MLEHVLDVVRRLSKDASSLIDPDEVVQWEEVAVLIEGTLLQETHVRNSYLQAQVVRHVSSGASPDDWLMTEVVL